MEVTQQLQPMQDKACMLFREIETQGTELEQVVILAEQSLDGLVNGTLIQEFAEARGRGTVAGRSSSSQAQGIRGRIAQTRVTRDESQVSFGGLLALNQVLRNTWSYLTIFGTSTTCRRRRTR
jgi:hypothetical protein